LNIQKTYFFFELSSKFYISKIHQVLFGYVRIQIFFVVIEGIKRVIIELTFVFVVVHKKLYLISNSNVLLIIILKS